MTKIGSTQNFSSFALIDRKMVFRLAGSVYVLLSFVRVVVPERTGLTTAGRLNCLDFEICALGSFDFSASAGSALDGQALIKSVEHDPEDF